MSMNDTNQAGGKGNGAPKIVALIVALLLVAGGGAWLVAGKGEKAETGASAVETAAVETDSAPSDAASAEADAASAEAAGAETAAETAAGTDAKDVKAGDPVVAVVDGDEIKRSDVFSFIGTLPDHIRQMPVDNLFPLALDQVIANEVIGKRAETANISGDPEVEKLMAQAKDQIVRSVYVEREVESRVTPQELRKAYDDLVAKIGKVEETHARHILVDTEEKAKEVIAKLDGGSRFEDLAKEYTADPSGQDNGGDLGYFAKTDMVPEFADAAFALQKGQYGKTPVKTAFGWHVIKVEDRRTRPAPKFEEVKAQLEQQLRQKTLTDLVEGWQKDANVRKFDINGNPLKDDGTKAN